MKYKMLLIIILPLILAGMLSSPAYGQTCTADTAGRRLDSLQLVNLWNKTNGSNWVTKWTLTNPVSGWYGVIMTSNGCRVKTISMHNNRVTGSLPDTLDLPELTSLRFSNPAAALGKLGGGLPDMSFLPKLENLNLTYNNISATLPSDFSDSLKILLLSYNQLNGTIPAYMLSNLSELRLNNNSLTGSIPDFGDSPKLAILDLSTNQLSGNIPAFDDNDSLTHILLYANSLTGSIPDFNLGKLRVLYLYNNQLTGSLPLFSNTVLEDIRLYSNQISSTVPDYAISSLRTLHLNNNPLYGVLPAFNALVNLTDLRIYTTQVAGYLPLFTNNPLETLYLFNNSHTGPLPNYRIPSLKNLSVQQNSLTGSLHNYNLPNMENFIAHTNQFTGTLPAFDSMPKLKQLLLNTNFLCGSLPAGISLPELTYLNVGDNSLSGTVDSTFINGMPKITDLRIYDNDFEGLIPNFSSSTLAGLQVFYNRFSGRLPSFHNALKLKDIRAGHNLLSGPIPNYKARPGSDTANMYLEFVKNFFTFADIAGSPYNTVNIYGYRSQIIPLDYNASTGQLSVNAGYVNSESENTYVWTRRCGGTIETLPETSNTLTLPGTPDSCRYRCEISNSILTQNHNITMGSVTSTYKKLIIGSQYFVYKSLPNSLCNYDEDTLYCSDVMTRRLTLPVKYAGDTSFVKGNTRLQIVFPDEYIAADSFATVSPVTGTMAYESDTAGHVSLFLPDISEDIDSLTGSNKVLLGKGNFTINDRLGAGDEIDFSEVSLLSDCSGCSELEADFIYFYADNECALSAFDTLTGTIVIPFNYVDYSGNTVPPVITVSYRPAYTVDAYTTISGGSVVYSGGRYLVTFVLPATAFSSGRFKYKLEAVSQSGRRFRVVSDYYIYQQRDEPLLVYAGSYPDRFNIMETLKHPACDTYWYSWFKRPVADVLNNYPGIIKVNGVQQYSGFLTEDQVDDGYGLRTNSIMKGKFDVRQLPSCYTLEADYNGANGYVKSMFIDYKVMCKDR